MDRINGANTITLPSGKRGWVNKNAAAGVPGTQIDATSFMNPLQEELLRIIEVAGLVPDVNDWTQVLTALTGLFANKAAQVFSASGTFVVPAGVTRVLVTAVGGGGGGGGSVAGGFGSGGGGGGYARGFCVVTPLASVAVTIGSGGVPGSSVANGGGGSSTSFGALVSATGGQGGASNSPNGGQGGAGVGGLILQPGEWGRGGLLTGASQIFLGGEGGGTPFGLGARYVVNPTNGAINGVGGQVSGAGGSGGASASGSGATVTGGAGAAGLVIVEW